MIPKIQRPSVRHVLVTLALALSLVQQVRAAEDPSFRDQVLNGLGKWYPQHEFRKSDGKPNQITLGDRFFNLSNLQAKYGLTDQSPESFERVIKEFFSTALNLAESSNNLDPKVILPKLRPQITSADYADLGVYVHSKLGKTLITTLVIDEEKSYRYVLASEIGQFKIPTDKLWERSIQNLDRDSGGLEIQGGKVSAELEDGEKMKDGMFMAVIAGDGYDAARILIPKLRLFLSGKIGSPFYFVIPNRDFLLCWNKDAPDFFHESQAETAGKDYTSQPYSLSPYIYEVDTKGNMIEHLKSDLNSKGRENK